MLAKTAAHVGLTPSPSCFAAPSFDAATGDIAALRRLMAFSRRFVQGLRVQQLPSHLDLQLLFNAMEHSPASLAVSYGQRSVGMDYDRASFGASLADCRCVRCWPHVDMLLVLPPIIYIVLTVARQELTMVPAAVLTMDLLGQQTAAADVGDCRYSHAPTHCLLRTQTVCHSVQC